MTDDKAVEAVLTKLNKWLQLGEERCEYTFAGRLDDAKEIVRLSREQFIDGLTERECVLIVAAGNEAERQDLGNLAKLAKAVRRQLKGL